MSRNGHKRRTFRCKGCHAKLGDRLGDTLVTAVMVLTFKKSQAVECGGCGEFTSFKIDSKKVAVVENNA